MSASREKKRRREEKEQGPQLSVRQVQRRQDAFRRTVAVTVAVVVILALAFLALSGSGIMQANLTAMTVGGVPIKAAEFDYYYFQIYYNTIQQYSDYGLLEYLGFDPNKSLKRQAYDEEAGTSWAQYFEEQAAAQLQEIVSQSEQAKKNGVTLTASDTVAIDAQITSLEEEARRQGVKPERLLRQNYGRGINIKSFRAILERYYLAARCASEQVNSFQWSAEDLETYYEENRVNYDTVDYRVFSFGTTPPARGEDEEPYTGEELEAYAAEQQAKADDMLARVTTSEAFKALAREYSGEVNNPEGPEDGETGGEDGGEGEDGTEDGDGEDGGGDGEDENGEDGDAQDGGEPEEDSTLVTVKASGITSENLKGFLLDESRKAGDKTTVKEESAVLVLLFVDRKRDESETVDVRHILVKFDNDEEKQSAETRAEEILDEWKAGAATEESFAELANKYSDDGGSNTNGGLYEGLNADTSFVQPFKDWYLDPSRKPGDTGIVLQESDSYRGYHIMYFHGAGEFPQAWQSAVRNDMNSKAYEEWLTELMEANAYQRRGLGMLFTKSAG